MNKRTACMSDEESVRLTALGGLVRPPCWDRSGKTLPEVIISRILCPFCREYHAPAEVEACMVLPRKTASVNGSTLSTSSAPEPGLLKPFSELWAFLTQTTYEDGAKRRTGRISLSFDAGLLGLCLTCNETGQYAFLNGRTVDGLLEEAELRLSDGSLTFRASRKK